MQGTVVFSIINAEKIIKQVLHNSIIIIMKAKNVLMGLLLLLATGCSNDDDYIIDPNVYPIFGYWEFAGADYSSSRIPVDESIFIGRQGLLIKANGDVKYWDIVMEQYSESLWGKILTWDNGTLVIQTDLDETVSDGLYYTIKEVTQDKLIIRIFGGIAGLSYEEGYDYIYKRMNSKPTP